eukprot:3531626-Pleurochrysis_carterae.AAC.1
MQDFGEEQGADGGDNDAELVRLRAKLAAAKRAAQDRKVAQEKEKAKTMQELLALEQEKEHSGMGHNNLHSRRLSCTSMVSTNLRRLPPIGRHLHLSR